MKLTDAVYVFIKSDWQDSIIFNNFLCQIFQHYILIATFVRGVVTDKTDTNYNKQKVFTQVTVSMSMPTLIMK